MDCIDLFKRAAVALQTDSRYLALSLIDSRCLLYFNAVNQTPPFD